MTKPSKEYIDNPHLQTPKSPPFFRGTPLDPQDRFQNLHHPFIPRWQDVMRWKFLERNPYKQSKKSEAWNPIVNKDASWLNAKEDMIVYLGHCTFYIRINGISLFTDPIFGDIYPVKRKSEFPIDPKQLNNIDYILLSHDHRDHLDKSSLQLLSKQNPDARYLTGLGMKKLIHSYTCSPNIEEAGWYQQFSTNEEEIQITFIPSRHWARRGLSDTNKRLWGGFVIEASGKRIFFGGDSAYDAHYSDIGNLFGSFDYALLGIGAYEPIWFMKTNHQSPEEALQAFRDLKADKLIPMHYGTFDLSDEPMGMPLERLLAAANEQNLNQIIQQLALGEPLLI